MIFISDNGINILREATQWSLDGTFLLAPPPFMQLYIVSGLVGHYNLPAAYVYLPNKDADTYRIIMELIIVLVQKTPDTCTLDFEAGGWQGGRGGTRGTWAGEGICGERRTGVR